MKLRAPIAAAVAVGAALASTLVPGQARAQEGSRVADHPRVAEALHLLDVWLDARRDYESIPGMSMAVVHDQEMVWAGGYGFAHVERGVPATPGTMYSICSISKLFTSIGVLQLRDRGLLSLSDPVAKHLPWFDIRETHPEAGPVTIEGILTHSSGLPREAEAPYWSGPDYPFPTHEEIVARLSKQETLYPARTHYQYSNLGLTLAGEIVSAHAGTSWNDYVQAHILEPLGMSSTTTEHLDELRGDRLATGYAALDREGRRAVIPAYQVRGIGPAAGMLSTVEDLARFASWQFRVLAGEDDDVLDRNTLREMQRVHWLEPDGWSMYGLGFNVWYENDKTFVGHGGSCPGYESHLLLRVPERIATTFMTNGRRVSTRGFTQRAYDIVAPAIRAATQDPPVDYAPPAHLKKYTGIYQRPLDGESAVLVWQGQLVVIGLPTENPLGAMTKLRHVEGDRFRRERSDGTLGEEYLFEEGPDGMRMWRHNNYLVRVPR